MDGFVLFLYLHVVVVKMILICIVFMLSQNIKEIVVMYHVMFPDFSSAILLCTGQQHKVIWRSFGSCSMKVVPSTDKMRW